jgi:hypothetical protein
MAMTVGISALISVALGQRFNVLILIPTIILAMVSTAIIEVMRGSGLCIVVAFEAGRDVDCVAKLKNGMMAKFRGVPVKPGFRGSDVL